MSNTFLDTLNEAINTAQGFTLDAQIACDEYTKQIPQWRMAAQYKLSIFKFKDNLSYQVVVYFLKDDQFWMDSFVFNFTEDDVKYNLCSMIPYSEKEVDELRAAFLRLEDKFQEQLPQELWDYFEYERYKTSWMIV